MAMAAKLQHFFRLFPPYLLGDGLIKVTKLVVVFVCEVDIWRSSHCRRQLFLHTANLRCLASQCNRCVYDCLLATLVCSDVQADVVKRLRCQDTDIVELRADDDAQIVLDSVLELVSAQMPAYDPALNRA